MIGSPSLVRSGPASLFRLFLAGALLLGVFAVPRSAVAGSVTLNVDGNCTDGDVNGICDDTVTYRTIRAALSAATTGDVINIITSGPHTEAGLTVTKTVTIQGQGQTTTTVQAAAAFGIAATRLFTINAGSVVTLTNLTLRYGNVPEDASPEDGGAVLNRGTLILNTVAVLDNQAFSGGGAIYNEGRSFGAPTLWIINSHIEGNQALGYPGGGAIFSEARNNNTTVHMLDSVLLDNLAVEDGGGGLYNFAISNSGSTRTATVYITGTQILSNTAGGFPGGGGLLNDTLDNGSHAFMQVVSSTIAYNSAPEDYGGGLYNTSYNRDNFTTNHQAYAIVRDSVFYANSAGNNGGGLMNDSLDGLSRALLEVSNTTISGNTADGNGAGLANEAYNRDSGSGSTYITNTALITLTHVTLFGNLKTGPSLAGGPSDAAGISQFASTSSTTSTAIARITLLNSIVTGSTGDECYSLSNAESTSDLLGQSNFIDDDSCGLALNDGSAAGSLDPLADNGGPTLTHALRQYSPAAGGGSLAYCLPTDQIGTLRPQSGLCDAGAWQGISAAPTSFINADPPDGAVGLAYSYTISANGYPVTYTVVGGSLPPGLTLNPNGLLSGTPTVAGTYGSLVVRAHNAVDDLDSAVFDIVISEEAEYRLYLPLVLK